MLLLHCKVCLQEIVWKHTHTHRYICIQLWLYSYTGVFSFVDKPLSQSSYLLEETSAKISLVWSWCLMFVRIKSAFSLSTCTLTWKKCHLCKLSLPISWLFFRKSKNLIAWRWIEVLLKKKKIWPSRSVYVLKLQHYTMKMK